MASSSSLKNAGIIRKILKEEGFSEMAIRGALARMRQESNLNPKAIRKNDAGPGKHSRGIFQWNRDRLANLEVFAAAKPGRSRDDVATQARFFAAEAKGLIGEEGKWGKRLLNARTAEEAAEAAISLARPEGWRSGNPRAGHGWNNTVNWTKSWAAKANGPLTLGTPAENVVEAQRGVNPAGKAYGRMQEEGEPFELKQKLPPVLSQLDALSELLHSDELLNPPTDVTGDSDLSEIDNSPGAVFKETAVGFMKFLSDVGNNLKVAKPNTSLPSEATAAFSPSPTVAAITSSIRGMGK